MRVHAISRCLLLVAIGWALCAGSSRAAAAPEVDFVFVPAGDVEPGGPVHDYRVGRFEIRNNQFVDFLNDALANPTRERGQYMFFDVVTGDVYVNTIVDGGLGSGAGGRTLKMFTPGASGQIELVAGIYQVKTLPTDYSAHPVSGVTWYGAVKYCNWLTLARGMPPEQRAYTEDTALLPSGWHPATITSADWASRDLNDEERDELLLLFGFRLPMDGGVSGAGPYSEWHKVASARATGGVPVFDATYGFGRSPTAPSPGDANYLDSGDPFEPGTTPAGFYDGVNVLADTSLTVDTDNGYGLYDLSGNVWEWVQDQSPSDASTRRLRGGSWQSLATNLRVELATDRDAGTTDGATGFRVVQSVPHPMLVIPFADLATSGPWGGPYDPPQSDQITYDIINLGNVNESLSVSADVPWLDIDPTMFLLAPGETRTVTVTVAPVCSDGLTTGAVTGVVSFADESGLVFTQRNANLTVEEPVVLTPGTSLEATMPLGGTPTPSNMFYLLTSSSDETLEWSASWSDVSDPPTAPPWLTLNGLPAAAGIVPPHGSSAVNVALDVTVVSLLSTGTYQAQLSFVDDCTGETFVRTVSLEVVAPFSIAPTVDAVSGGVAGGPFTPTLHEFFITNLQQNSVSWTVALCTEEPGSATCTAPIAPTWLTLDEVMGDLAVDGIATVTASLTTTADTLEARTHELTLRFEEPDTGFRVDRVVRLEVTGLQVDPPAGVNFRGSFGGPFTPTSATYTLQNTGLPEMSWTATTVFDPPLGGGAAAWLEVTPSAGVIVELDGSDETQITLAPDAALLAPGLYRATITFEANGADTIRLITLTVGGEAFSLTMAVVPASDEQPFGPDYDFRMGQHEITKEQYVRFLNDVRNHILGVAAFGPPERSEYLYIDSETGDVYINFTQAGEQGVGPPDQPANTFMFEPDVGGAISLTVDGYVVEDGQEGFPVVGVSWFGAVKFCNWLSLIQGMSASERAYREGAATSDWIPVANLAQVRGFRLPIDGGEAAAAIQNEWYKAAAWLDVLGLNAMYGFGRDSLTEADANYLASGDPFEPDATPVQFFDGVSLLADGETLTSENDNGYGLFDMTGNVAEWVHDVGLTADERGLRGGHFNSVAGSSLLRNDMRGSAPASSTLAFVGFRVAQRIEPVSLATAAMPIRLTMPIGGSQQTPSIVLRIENLGSQTVDGLNLTFSPPWLEVDGVSPSQVPPGSAIDVPLRLSSAALSAGVSPAPTGDFSLVPGSDEQAGGPGHDFWISQSEVTNAQFSAFLADALADARSSAPSARSDHMYFDVLTGSVYINTQQAGGEGVGAPMVANPTLLYDASVGRIILVNGSYLIETGFSEHPIAGVSWYGALKYCNWLTLDQGLPESLRVYAEAPAANVDGWHPVVVDDSSWMADGLDGVDGAIRLTRAALIADTLGFRLPMDDRSTVASPYNEWFKATSRGGMDQLGDSIFSMPFGYGRSLAPISIDANYLDSQDTEFDGTTPVRFFDGVNALFSDDNAACDPSTIQLILTLDSDNGYRLYDATGNVAEWTQEWGTDFTNRAIRGGSWRDDASSSFLTTTVRDVRLPGAAEDDLGFRVVRGTGHVVAATLTNSLSTTGQTTYFVLDLTEPTDLTPRTNITVGGLYRDDFADRVQSYTLSNRSASDMNWSASVDQTWIDVTASIGTELTGILVGLEPGGVPDVIDFELRTNASASLLAPGTHIATLSIVNTTTNISHVRTATLTIEPPVSLDAEAAGQIDFSGVLGGPFDVSQPSQLIRLDNLAAFDLDYTVSTSASWLTIEPELDLSGTLVSGEMRSLTLSVNESADLLAVGEFKTTVRVVLIDRGNGDLSSFVERQVRLSVEDPIRIMQPVDPWELGPNPVPAMSQIYTLANDSADPVEVLISTDVDWLDLDISTTELLPAQQRAVTASLNDTVSVLFDGEYYASINFQNTTTGEQQCRQVVVIIEENLSVAPFGDFVTAGRVNGSIQGLVTVYTLTNVARDANGSIDWDATVDVNWLRINGAASQSGTLDDGEVVTLIVAVQPDLVPQTAGTHLGTITIGDLTHAESHIRTVSLSMVVSQFEVRESTVTAAPVQTAGPDYAFNLATFHTTNGEFVAFLNNARVNLDNERGEYLFFDTLTGDVYVNTMQTGEVGADPGTRTVQMFSPMAGEQISFAGGVYSVDTSTIDYTDHPVTGVSWFGAIKYCNWLTLDQGMLATARCYNESTEANLTDWRPVTVSETDWSTRDLDDAERTELVERFRGYRLPMDDGSNNPDVAGDQADAYNEWYKGAAWMPATGMLSLYGFGRDILSGDDANFNLSGDPFDELSVSTTPVGYFDGTDHGGVFATNPLGNENGYGLFDMTGNVFQWLQGRFNNNVDSIDHRTIRGGSWGDTAASEFLSTRRRTFRSSGATMPWLGFRVVRTLPNRSGDFDMDGDLDINDFSGVPACLTGPDPSGTPMPSCLSFDLESDNDFDLRDLALLQQVFTGSPR